MIARNLARLPVPAALSLAGLLYLVGVGGDSYYGFTVAVPVLKTLYDGIFLVFSYTRNGLFFAPSFFCWERRDSGGAAGPPPRGSSCPSWA